MTSGGAPRPGGSPPPLSPGGGEADDVDRVTRIVFEALEREGGERRAYVERECGGDDTLRAEVDSLIAEHDRGEPDFLEVPAPARFAGLDTTVDEPPSDERRAREAPADFPDRIGPYRIVDRLGEGGMATVYLAEQDEPVRRRVALKVIRALRQPRVRERFAAECQALARLNHPNIASLYEVGATAPGEGGRPYVAMEWVEGEHVTTWCDAREADVATRLELFRGVCAGIGHAHEKGVLHCDLKPSNVLVTEVDGRAVAKVIDFGIARALDQPLIASGETLTGEMFLGSPQYISPEAARRGGRKTLDARSDVYSLGLILYELLTGVLPLDMGEHSFWSFLAELSKREPEPPSERFRDLEPERAAALAAARGLDPAGLIRALRGDLDAVVCKATALDPAERYGSPSDLAADLERHLRHRPVAARGASTAYVAGRFARRHLGVAVSGALLVLALGGGLVARTIEARRANAEAARARAALAESEEVREFMVGLFEGADPDRAAGESMTVRELLDQGAERLGDELADRPLVRARFLATIGAIYRKLGVLSPAEETIAEALALREERLPPGHPEVLESRSELGVIYRQQGRLEEAEPLLESVLAARRAAPDTDPRLLANAYNDVGNLYWSAERYDEAEAAHRAALAIRGGIPGAEADEALSANNLGVLLLSLDRYAEARPLLERAAEGFRTELGEGHPRRAAALNNLGLADRNLESWPEAEERFREAVTIWEAAYGDHDRRPLLGRRNLVGELLRKHRWPQALAEARALTAVAEGLDGDLVGLLAVLRLEGRCRYLSGDFAGAFETLRRAVALAGERLGDEHPATLSARNSLAAAYLEAGEVEPAVELLEAIAGVQDRTLDPDHPSRLRTEAGLGHAAMAAGRYRDAEEHYLRLVSEQTRRLGEQHPATATALHDLGRSVAAQGRDDEAAALLARALAIRRAVFGPEHPTVAETAHELALVEARRGNVERARELLEQAIAIRRAVYPADDDDLRASLEALAAL